MGALIVIVIGIVTIIYSNNNNDLSTIADIYSPMDLFVLQEILETLAGLQESIRRHFGRMHSFTQGVQVPNN